MQQLRLETPSGYRFKPTDEDLVGFFLYKKLKGVLSSSLNTFVPDSDLYAQDEPWQLWQKFNDNLFFSCDGEIYLFTPLKKKGSRVLRSVGNGGTWHGVDSGKPVKTRQPDDRSRWLKGTKKSFTYQNENSAHNGCWIMHEFSLFNVGSDWVLCRLKKNFSDNASDDTSKNKRRKILVSSAGCDNSEQRVLSDVGLAEQQAVYSYWASVAVPEHGNGGEVEQHIDSEIVTSDDNCLVADGAVVQHQVLSNGALISAAEKEAVDNYLSLVPNKLLDDDQSFDYESQVYGDFEPLFAYSNGASVAVPEQGKAGELQQLINCEFVDNCLVADGAIAHQQISSNGASISAAEQEYLSMVSNVLLGDDQSFDDKQQVYGDLEPLFADFNGASVAVPELEQLINSEFFDNCLVADGAVAQQQISSNGAPISAAEQDYLSMASNVPLGDDQSFDDEQVYGDLEPLFASDSYYDL